MGDIPLRTEHGNAASRATWPSPRTPLDPDERRPGQWPRQVYIPVLRQIGASTLSVVDTLKSRLATMKARLTRPGIDLKVVMDQSVYVRQSIESLATRASWGPCSARW